MKALSPRHISKAGRPVFETAEHRRPSGQMSFGPLANFRCGKTCNGRQLDKAAVALSVHRDRCHERHLVFGVSAELATSALPALVSIVHLHLLVQQVSIFTTCAQQFHHAHEFVEHQPVGEIADTRLALQRQRTQPCLGLVQQVQTRAPQGQRQLGVLEHGARVELGLMEPAIALEQLVRAGVGRSVRGGGAYYTYCPVDSRRGQKKPSGHRAGSRAAAHWP